MAGPFCILGIAGSLRRGSFNQAMLRAAQSLTGDDAAIEVFDLNGIPLFNEDEEQPLPARVLELKQCIRRADAILIATPEYNYSIPGVLKNAIDWASRPDGDSAWREKPIALMGASLGRLGTSRAQYHLRQVLVSLNAFTMSSPEVMIGNAEEHFDGQGNLIDETTQKRIRHLVGNLVSWTRRIGRPGDERRT